MIYSVKEIFYTLQGEGANTGRPAVFCRFAGCNLWSGREQDRGRAVCRFCDTDFRGTDGVQGGKYWKAAELADRIAATWLDHTPETPRFVVCTGGEPLLQLDAPLIEALHARGIQNEPLHRGAEVASGRDHGAVSEVLRDLKSTLEAESARIEASFPYFLERLAPVSEVAALVDYQ